jgi:hypothetical protein
MAPVRVGEDVVGVLVLVKDGPFEPGAGKTATEILRIVGTMLGQRRHMAVGESECEVGRAVLRGVGPKDITYRVFHQLRRFIDYDHGATLIERLDQGRGRVLARQVTWTSGRSDIVGKVVPFAWDDLEQAISVMSEPYQVPSLAETVGSAAEEGSPPKLSSMLGMLGPASEVIGCVEVSSRRRMFFVDKDTQILSRFVPYLTWCLKNLKDREEDADV